MTTDSVNSNQFNEVFLQNSSKLENGAKVDTQYQNCIFELNDYNGIIERSDMIDDNLERYRDVTGEYVYESPSNKIYERIQNFFTNNSGKNWTDALKNEIVNLIELFNRAEATKRTNTYNDQGKIVQSTEYNPNGTIYYREYDENGNNVRMTIENKKGIYCTQEKTYDEKNRETSSIEYDRDNKPSSKTIYSYANDGKIVKREHSFCHNGKWDKPFVDILELDKNGEFCNVTVNKTDSEKQKYIDEWFKE